MEWWTAAEAVRLAAPQLPFLLGSKDPDGASKSLGKYLSTEVDRVNEGFILEAWRDRKRATYWRVKVVATP